jgi:hypothetical protein
MKKKILKTFPQYKEEPSLLKKSFMHLNGQCWPLLEANGGLLVFF